MKRKLIQILFPFIFLFASFGFFACNHSEEPPARLATPSNLIIDEGILTWDEVEDADGYYVYIDEAENQTTECRYDLTGLITVKDYTVKVVAHSVKEEVNDSEYAAITYKADDILTAKGFEFKQVTKGTTYKVTKFAVDENGVCVIPSMYKGEKVVQLEPQASDPAVHEIKSLYLPNTIEPATYDASLSDYSYSFGIKYFSSLESIELEQGSGNGNYIVEGNGLINNETHTLVVGFLNCEIPNSVTSIGQDAFAWRNLTEFTVPDFIKEIGSGAFHGCELLKVVSLPAGIEEIGSGVFWGCTSLKSVAIPDSVTSIEGNAFQDCSSLASLVLPSGLTEIGAWAFVGCSALKEVTIPESVTSLGAFSFRECTSLKSVIILGNIPKIEIHTFEFCTSLNSIVIPKSVTYISMEAFRACPLQTVYYSGTEKEWGRVYVDFLGTTYDIVRAATKYYYSESTPETTGNFWHYVDDVPTAWPPYIPPWLIV